MNTTTTRTAVVEMIKEAFPAVPIDSADAFTPWGLGYLDAAPYRAALAGPWTELDRAYLLRRSDALGFLATAHLAAVLPVYLTALVEDGVWSPAAGMLTIILARPSTASDSGLGVIRFDALVEVLSAAQRTAVATSLAAFAAQDEEGSLGMAAAATLADFWAAYLPSSVPAAR